ncbi:hypothetical protein M9H77_00098 [Catharanthus roseus]|nr:hypothetical protein M9H77_00098 [Catharanthus roseus]
MLYSCNLPEISSLQTFSLLKIPSLGWIGLPSVSIENLISECPVLEFLSLKQCWNLSSLHVLVPRLNTLIVDNCFPPSLGIIIINAPNLLSLNQLKEAELNFGVEEKFIEAGDVIHNGEGPLFIKSGLAVKHLILKTTLEREDFYGITLFLRSCPHLERLTIDSKCIH